MKQDLAQDLRKQHQLKKGARTRVKQIDQVMDKIEPSRLTLMRCWRRSQFQVDYGPATARFGAAVMTTLLALVVLGRFERSSFTCPSH